MKKITYCKKCGNKVMDNNFCPNCGSKINQERMMDKSRRTRKILLIILAIVLIGDLLIIGGAYNSNNNKTFVKHNFSDTCSVELPKWIKFHEGAGDINSNANIAGSSVQSTTKALFGNSQVMQITYGKSTVDGSAVGADLNDAMNMNIGNKKVYTRTVMSAETGEFVTVMGENETLVNYIAEHTLFNGKHGANKTNDSTTSIQQSGNTQQKAVNTDKPADIDEKTYKAICDTYGSYENYQKVLAKQAEIRSYGSEEAYAAAHGYYTPTPSSDTGGSGSGGSCSTAT